MSPVEEGWSAWCTRTDEWDVCAALIKNGEGEMSLLSSKIWRIVTEKAFCGGTAKGGEAMEMCCSKGNSNYIYIKKEFFKARVSKHEQESRDEDTENLAGQGLGLMIYLWQGIGAASLFLDESGSSRFNPGGIALALQ